MSVCTRTLKATPPDRHRAISSPSTTLDRKSPPPPPYSTGNSRPSRPSSPSRRQNTRGIRPASSHASTCGVTSLSTKARMVRRSISCSSPKRLVLMGPRVLDSDWGLLVLHGYGLAGTTVYLAAAGAQGAPAKRPSLKRALVAGTDLVYPDRHSEPRGPQGWRSARRPTA